MIWIYIIISAAFAVIYFAKTDNIRETITVFIFWPLVLLLVIILTPAAVYKKLKEK